MELGLKERAAGKFTSPGGEGNREDQELSPQRVGLAPQGVGWNPLIV